MDLFSLELNETKTEIIVFGGKNFLKEKLCIHGTFLKGGGGGSKANFFGGSDLSFGYHRCP